MEDVYSRVLWDGYGLKLAACQRVRTGLICKTQNGLKELRNYGTDTKRLCFESKAREHLRKNGCDNVLCFQKTVEDEPFYQIDGTNFVLEDYIAGEALDMEKKEQLFQAAAVLAKLHNASENFEAQDGFSNLGKLPENMIKRRNELVRVKKWIARQSNYSSVDLIVAENFSYYLKKIELAEEMLKESGYTQLVAQAKEKKTFCHNQFKGDNVRFTQEEKGIVVSGFGSCAYDCITTDVAEFVRRAMKSPDIKPADVQMILEQYQKVRPLKKEEKKLVLATLSFPGKFLKIINAYYNRRRVYVSDAVVQKLKRCVLLQQKEEEFLAQVSDI